MAEQAPLHAISRQHLDAMTGELGILQHAVGSRPDPAHGYCVDDVARALEVDLLHAQGLGWAVVAASADRSVSFLEDAFDLSTGRFRNFRSMDGTWIGGAGSDDSVGRAMLALGETLAAAPDPGLCDRTVALVQRALPAVATIRSLRARASVVLACDAVVRSTAMAGTDGDRHRAVREASAAVMRRLATGLHARFVMLAGQSWPWPEASLTYENALIPRALIVAGERLPDEALLATGLDALDWLITVQTSAEDRLSPVGNGWWPRGGTKSQFDQQPIEATALLLAAEAAHQATGDPRYVDAMERAYGWFLGANDLGLRVAHPARGACSDGLTSTGLNTNEGAESTLMWLIAAERIRRLRTRMPRVAPPARIVHPDFTTLTTTAPGVAPVAIR